MLVQSGELFLSLQGMGMGWGIYIIIAKENWLQTMYVRNYCGDILPVFFFIIKSYLFLIIIIDSYSAESVGKFHSSES